MSPHAPQQHFSTRHGMHSLVYGTTVLVLTSNLIGLFPSSLYFSSFSFHRPCMPCSSDGPPSSFPSWLPACDHASIPMGGGRPYLFSHALITSFIKKGNEQLSTVHVFRYVDHADEIGCLAYPVEHGFVYADLSLTDIVPHLSKQMVQKIARIHKIPLSSHWRLTKDQLVQVFEGHDCINCNHYTSVLEAQTSPQLKKKHIF